MQFCKRFRTAGRVQGVKRWESRTIFTGAHSLAIPEPEILTLEEVHAAAGQTGATVTSGDVRVAEELGVRRLSMTVGKATR